MNVKTSLFILFAIVTIVAIYKPDAFSELVATSHHEADVIVVNAGKYIVADVEQSGIAELDTSNVESELPNITDFNISNVYSSAEDASILNKHDKKRARNPRITISGNRSKSSSVGVAISNSNQRSDPLAVVFLQAAYENAVNSNPAVAADIRRELDTFYQDGINNQEDFNDADVLDEKSNNEDVDALAESNRSEEFEKKENNESESKSDDLEPELDYQWCGSGRSPLQSGVFRCPCPSDINFVENWRSAYSKKFLTSQGCI